MYLLHAVHFAKRGLMNCKTTRSRRGNSQRLIDKVAFDANLPPPMNAMQTLLCQASGYGVP